jgi:hypothetical protein
VVSMGVTVLEVERDMSGTWQERREESPRRRNSDCVVGI